MACLTPLRAAPVATNNLSAAKMTMHKDGAAPPIVHGQRLACQRLAPHAAPKPTRACSTCSTQLIHTAAGSTPLRLAWPSCRPAVYRRLCIWIVLYCPAYGSLLGCRGSGSSNATHLGRSRRDMTGRPRGAAAPVRLSYLHAAEHILQYACTAPYCGMEPYKQTRPLWPPAADSAAATATVARRAARRQSPAARPSMPAAPRRKTRWRPDPCRMRPRST